MLLPAVPANDVSGVELLSEGQRKKSLGLNARPLGPAQFGYTSAGEFYTAASMASLSVRAASWPSAPTY